MHQSSAQFSSPLYIYIHIYPRSTLFYLFFIIIFIPTAVHPRLCVSASAIMSRADSNLSGRRLNQLIDTPRRLAYALYIRRGALARVHRPGRYTTRTHVQLRLAVSPPHANYQTGTFFLSSLSFFANVPVFFNFNFYLFFYFYFIFVPFYFYAARLNDAASERERIRRERYERRKKRGEMKIKVICAD